MAVPDVPRGRGSSPLAIVLFLLSGATAVAGVILLTTVKKSPKAAVQP